VFYARLVGFDDVIHEIQEHADAGAEDGMERASALIAAEARSRHAYTNRTTNLQRSTHHVPPHGSLHGGNLTGLVVADEDYASYVEDAGYAFLLPAFVRRQSEAARVMTLALRQALNGG